MQESQIIQRIEQLRQSRSWSLYRLAKESDITYSTLCTMLRKNNTPSLSTLIRLCNGFGITLKQFFEDGEDSPPLNRSQKALLQKWAQLSPADRQTAERFLNYLLDSRSK